VFSLQLLYYSFGHIFVSFLNLCFSLELLVDGSHKRILVAFLHIFIIHVLCVLDMIRVILTAINYLLLLTSQPFIV
jgi:hypothetical protein